MALLTSFMLVIYGFYGDTIMPISMSLIAVDPRWHIPAHFVYALLGIAVGNFFLIFPTGQYVPAWTRWIALIVTTWVMLPVFFPDTILNIYRWPDLPLLLYEVATFAVYVLAQIYRYRHVSTPIQRQQTKWVLYGSIGAIIINLGLSASVVVLIPAVNQPGLEHVFFEAFRRTLNVLTGLALMLPITFAIMRYKLWDVDLVINRSLVYGAVTAVLGLTFLLSVYLMQQVFQLFTGEMQSPIAQALSTLVVGALFQPAHTHLRRFINRRFYHLVVDIEQLNHQHDAKPITNPGALTGMALGQYQVLEPVGSGGMGEVYRGVQPGLDREVAIKVLPRHLASEAEFRLRFEREARAVAGLRHPNVVSVYDFGTVSDMLYMVMEYVDGQTLSSLLKMYGRIPLDIACDVIADIAAALDYAHGHGLVHRDVKPSNIMFQRTDETHMRAILMDFGIARLVDAGTRVTGSGILGTLDYAAPEQILAARDVDCRADVYALGVVAYQMLTGKLPFEGEGLGQLVFAHLYKPAPDPRLINAGIPDTVAEATLQALAKDPAHRLESAGAFAALLLAECQRMTE